MHLINIFTIYTLLTTVILHIPYLKFLDFPAVDFSLIFTNAFFITKSFLLNKYLCTI